MIDPEFNLIRILAALACIYAIFLSTLSSTWKIPFLGIVHTLTAVMVSAVIFDFGTAGLKILGSKVLAVAVLVSGAFVLVYYAGKIIEVVFNTIERWILGKQ